MRHFLAGLCAERQTTIVISSHILSEIELLAHRIGVIHEGKLLEELTVAELRRRNRKYMEFQVSNQNKAAMLLEHRFGLMDFEIHEGGIIRIYSHIGEQGSVNRLLVEHGLEVTRISLSEDWLEDYFVKLIGGGTVG